MYSIRFYSDLPNYHQTTPCKRHSHTYKTFEEAHEIARKLLPAVRLEYGHSVGYSITDDETGHVCHIGPGVSEWDKFSPKDC